MSNYQCFSPNNGKVFSEIKLSKFAEINQWIRSRKKVVIAEQDRLVLLRDLSEKITQAGAALGYAIEEEVGKTPSEARGEVLYAASFVDAALAALRDQLDQYRNNPSLPTKSPLGPALLITAFNDPIAGITRKLAPAIAAGCPVVIKPSPWGFFSAKALENCLPDGLQKYVFFAYLENLSEINSLITESEIAVISMTGSTAAGREIAKKAGNRVIPCVLELGGNCPFVIFRDADVKKAARDILERKTRAAGQACSAVNRVLVDTKVMKELELSLQSLQKDYVCGPSKVPGIAFGPVRNLDSVTRLKRLEHELIASGAKLVLRASVNDPGGASYAYPLTAYQSDSDSPLDFEEAFGPLFVIRQFSNEEELEMLIETNRQNLAAYFYGKQAEVFLKSRPWIRFGSIGFDTTKIQGPDIPTGGFGEAGYGREGGFWGIDEFEATVNRKGISK